MVQLGFREPANDVVQGGSLGPEFLKVGANATAAYMIPGAAVIKDTNDFSVKEGAAGGKLIGYIGYASTPAEFRPETITTAHALGDHIAVHRGAGRRQKTWLADGQSVVNGQPLKLTASGQLAAATINGVVAVNEAGSETAVSTGNDEIVADADETVAASGAAAAIWVITRK